MDLLLRNPDLPTGKLLHTFECAFHYNFVIGPGNLLFDEKGWGIDISDQRWEIYHRVHSKRDAEWPMVFEPHKLSCRICHSDELIVSFDPNMLHDPGCGFLAEALACMECSLLLDPSYKTLARLHYGQVTKERVGEAVWADLKAWLRDWGSSLEYDPELLG